MAERWGFCVTTGVAAVCATTLACDPGGSARGLADSLSDPTPTEISGEGVRLRAGHYSQLGVVLPDDEATHVLAIEHGEQDDRLVILPLEAAAGCSAGPASTYLDLSWGQGLVAFLEPGNDGEPERLHFVDFECQEVFEPLVGAPLPSTLVRDYDGIGRGYAVLAGDALYLIRRDEPELIELETNVSKFDVADGQIWALADGELSVFNISGRELERYGHDVTEFVAGPIQGAQAAYVETGELFFAYDPGVDPVSVREDVCHLHGHAEQFATGLGGLDYVAFHSPCSERRLALASHYRVPGLAPQVDPLVFEYAARDVHPESILLSGRAQNEALDWAVQMGLDEPLELEPRAPGIFHVLSDDPDAEVGTLVFEDPGAEILETIGDDGYLGGDGLLTNYDGRTGTRWVELPTGEPRFLSIGDDSLPAWYGGYVVDFDGETGTLLHYLGGGWDDPSVVARGFPDQKTLHSVSQWAFVADLEGRFGNLYFAEGFDDVPEVLASRVRPDTVRRMGSPPSVGYLGAPASDGAAAFRLWIDELETEVMVSPAVTEFLPMPPFLPGLLYITTEPGREGIWFVRPR